METTDHGNRPLAARIVQGRAFKGTVLGAIVVGAVLVGLETVPAIHDAYGALLWSIDRVVLGVFVIEVLLKLAAEGRRPWRYFADPWNVFDFAVTAICLLPLDAKFAQVLRLGRVARSLRLITALPRLQVIVTALLRSLPSFGWITLLLLTLMYVYSVMAVFLFGANDPARFGSLWNSMLTMFSVLTLEGWFEVMTDQMNGIAGADGAAAHGSPVVAPLFFVSFIMSGTMIFLNLLVGVIVNSMSEIPGATDRDKASPLPSITAPAADSEHAPVIAERLARLEDAITAATAELAALRREKRG
ncbi:MAG: ion transporter [Planctomycetota bacterium]